MNPAICLAVLSIVTLLHTDEAFIFGPKIVELKADKNHMCSGQNQSVTCTINDGSFHANSLTFQHNKVDVNREDIVVVNNKTALITLQNIQTKTNIICCVESCEASHKNPIDEIIIPCSQMPLQVSNMSCIIKDYFGNVTCTWSYGVDYSLDETGPNVTFFIGMLETDNIANKTISFLEDRVEFTESALYQLFNQINALVRISISVKSPCGMTVNTTFQGADVIRVKPNPVAGFQSMAVNSTCIQLNWWHDRPSYKKSFFITAVSDFKRKEVYLNETSSNDTIQETVLCDLNPGTQYTFTIAVNSLDVDRPGIWSKLRETSNKTHDDVPGSSPVVAPGGYSWERDSCKNGVLRFVYIYWKLIEEEDHHGTMVGTRITFTTGDESEYILVRDLRATFTAKQLSCQKNYNVTVQAQNTIGLSAESTSFTITAASNDVTRDLLVERSKTNDNVVYLDWSLTEPHGPEGFKSTVFYFEKNGPEPDCSAIIRGEALWFEFSTETTNASLTLPPGKEPENFCYGISVQTKTESSGFDWSSCVNVKDVAPTKAPADLKVSTGPEDNTLIVTWSKWLCEVGEPHVKLYNLYYCIWESQSNCTGAPVILSFDREETSAVLSNLDSEKQYAIRGRAVSYSGIAGPWSEPILGQSKFRGLKTDAIVGISVGGVFIGVLAIAGIIFVARYCQSKAKYKLNRLKQIEHIHVDPDPEVKEKPLFIISNPDKIKDDISMPPRSTDRGENGDENENSEDRPTLEISRQISVDSGIHEGPHSPDRDSDKKQILDNIPEVSPKDYVRVEGYVGPQEITVAPISMENNSSGSYVQANAVGSPNNGFSLVRGDNVTWNDNRAFSDDHGNNGGNPMPLSINNVAISEKTKLNIPCPRQLGMEEECETMEKQNPKGSKVASSIDINKNTCRMVPDYITTDSDFFHKLDKNTENIDKSAPDRKGPKSEDMKPTSQAKHLDDSTDHPELDCSVLSEHNQPHSANDILAYVAHVQTPPDIGIQAGMSDCMAVQPIQTQSVKQKESTGHVPLADIQYINETDEQSNLSGYVLDVPVLNLSNIHKIPPSTRSKFDQQTDLFDYASHSPVHLLSQGSDSDKTDNSTYVTYPPDKQQAKTLGDNPSGKPFVVVSVPNGQSGHHQLCCDGTQDQHRLPDIYSGYVSNPPIQKLSEPETNSPGYVSHPPIQKLSEPETNSPGYVSHPPIQKLSEPETNSPGYVSHPPIQKLSEPETNSPGYVTHPPIQKLSEPETTSPGYVTHPSIQKLSEPETNSPGYVTHPSTQNLSEPETTSPGYVSHPSTQNLSEKETTSPGYVTHPPIQKLSEPVTTSPGYVSHPSTQNLSEPETTSPGYVSHPSTQKLSEPETNSPGYVSHPPIQKLSEPETNSPGYVTHPSIQKLSEPETNSPGYVTHPSIQNLSEPETTSPGYVTHQPVQNLYEPETTSPGYVTHPSIQNLSEPETTSPGYVTHQPVQNLYEPETTSPGYVTHQPIHQ